MQLIINIKKELFDMLPILYPTLSIETELRKSDRFILRWDIRSQKDIINLKDRFDNFVVVSTVLFEEEWTEATLIEKAVEFARVRFKSRKRTVKGTEGLEGKQLIERLKEFIFLQSEVEDEEDEGIMELFNLYGQARFNEVFLKMTETEPLPKLISSMNTFVSKIVGSDESSSLFYKKKAILLKDKIRLNYKEAFELLKESRRDTTGLNYLKFYNDLVR